VQNPGDRIARKRKECFESVFIPHWIQPRLIPRDKERKNSFVSARYYGDENNAARELKSPSWKTQLSKIGLEWNMVTDPERWADYSDVDILVSVRKFGSKVTDFTNKPATKLYNAWHAGVPAVLAAESAYAAERKSELDYLEAHSPGEAIDVIMRLRGNQTLREAIAGNGKVRARETSAGATVRKWRNFLMNVAVPAYRQWRASDRLRAEYLFSLRLAHLGTRIKRKISRLRALKKSG